MPPMSRSSPPQTHHATNGAGPPSLSVFPQPARGVPSATTRPTAWEGCRLVSILNSRLRKKLNGAVRIETLRGAHAYTGRSRFQPTWIINSGPLASRSPGCSASTATARELGGFGAGLVIERSLSLGEAHVVDAVWRRLQLDWALGELLAERAYERDFERLMFAMVANRALRAPRARAAAPVDGAQRRDQGARAAPQLARAPCGQRLRPDLSPWRATDVSRPCALLRGVTLEGHVRRVRVRFRVRAARRAGVACR
jgi:hypothetical protein